jgi:RHH-type proline utilization regulon transcriptional repressor/proline dehydrogenase/delta 1-pyrroline-5-carboxylate dehydrogenase
VRVGNIYANRNQIGAIVGSQPFGGEGLSGTGPKAGGPHYLARFTAAPAPRADATPEGVADPAALARSLGALADDTVLDTTLLPGPTGELNRLTTLPRAPLLCLGPGAEAAAAQVAAVEALGGRAVAIDATLDPGALVGLPALGGVIWWGDTGHGRALARALAERPGPIVPLITGRPDAGHAVLERHLCVDTTAAGGNASLLAGSGD